MGQCVSRVDGDFTFMDNNAVHTVPAVKIGRKGRKKAKLTKHASFKTKPSLKANSDADIEPTRSTDSSESNHSKCMKLGITKGVVVIPEATECASNESPIDVHTEDSAYNLSSPTGTVTTALTTPSLSIASRGSTLRVLLDESNTEVQGRSEVKFTSNSFQSSLSPEYEQRHRPATLDSVAPTSLEDARTASESLFEYSKNTKNQPNHEQATTATIHIKSKQGSSSGRTLRNTHKKAISKDLQHPDSQILDETEDIISANFTPIKQTTLQSKVTVIREEEDPDAPSDEEDFHDKTILRKVQRDMNPKNRVSGPLTPVKLRTQWNTTPSSIHVREPAMLLSGSLSFHSSPLLNGETTASARQVDREKSKAVDECLMSNFQKLKLQVAVADQQTKRNQKVAKLEDRLKDVQGYRELWGEFQNIQKQVCEVDLARGSNDEKDCTDAADDLVHDYVEYDLEDDNKILSGRRRKTPYRTRKALANLSEKIEASNAFDLKDSKTWVFDFQAEGFDVHGAAHDDDSSQADLSLLSEKSMEVQRRFFAQKRKQRKQQKRLQKEMSENGSSGPIIVDGTPITRNAFHRARSEANVSTTSSYGDYGPESRLRRARSFDLSNTEHLNESTSSVIADMESAFRFPGSDGVIRVDNDNCSLVSDLEDDRSFSTSVASGSQYARDASSVGSGNNNDYRVNRRRPRQYSHRPVDLEKFVPSSSSSVGSWNCSVSERRKAIEMRLQMLNTKQQDELSKSETSGRPSLLTRKFEEAVTLSSIKNSNNLDSAVDYVSGPRGDLATNHNPLHGSSKLQSLTTQNRSTDGSFLSAIAAPNASPPVRLVNSTPTNGSDQLLPPETFTKVRLSSSQCSHIVGDRLAIRDFIARENIGDLHSIEISRDCVFVESAESQIKTMNDGYAKYDTPKAELDLTHKNSTLCAGCSDDLGNFPKAMVTAFENDENRMGAAAHKKWNGSHAASYRQSEEDDEAKKVLLLADQIATSVKHVLERYRSSDLGEAFQLRPGRPHHDDLYSQPDQPPHLVCPIVRLEDACDSACSDI